ncbi:hypothetical protein [Photobacterium damselae]|uniref:Uncharacterized protein n=1 Tax=Photobacterium damselae TaxID=38293 RepID=A0A2T3QL88_PHODM|nr:hypothetical protein [Photobacterium damselae]PSW85819.1 hypothetical protein CTN07_07950 [Photobacterium damselae]SPY44024.1 Uncharacterised protein [Photobacterium damselae]
MTKIIAPSMRDTLYAGPAGNLSVAVTGVTLKAAVTDTEVELIELPIGLNLIGLRVVTSGLGTGVKVDVKVGKKILATELDVSSKSAVTMAIEPVYLVDNTTLELVIKGGSATGDISVMPEYISVGF